MNVKLPSEIEEIKKRINSTELPLNNNLDDIIHEKPLGSGLSRALNLLRE